MSELDEVIEGALNEAAPPAEPVSREEPPSSEEPSKATAEAEPEPAAGADEAAPGVTTTQEPPAEAEPEKPNAFVPREALDAVREQARIYKELYEEAQGKAEPEKPEPEEEPEFATVLEEQLWRQNKDLEARVEKGEAFLQQIAERDQMQAAVTEAGRQFEAAVADLQEVTGAQLTLEQKTALLGEAAALGKLTPDMPVATAVYRAHLQLQKAANAPKPTPANPKPGGNGAEALAKIAAEKEGLERSSTTAPPPGGKPLDQRMTLDQAVEKAVQELGTG